MEDKTDIKKDESNGSRIFIDPESKEALHELYINFEKMRDGSISEEVLDRTLYYYKDYLNWKDISAEVYLSEKLIECYKDYVDWERISYMQKLSEEFISRYKDKVHWNYICIYQKLSESFIREHDRYIKNSWDYVSYYQTLSERFMHEYKDKLVWNIAYQQQKMSFRFMLDHIEYFDKVFKNINIDSHKWLKKISLYMRYRSLKWRHKSTAARKRAVKRLGLYECHKDYFIAYKGIRKNRYSKYNFQHQYLKGSIHESDADYTNIINSYGLNVWTKNDAFLYCRELVVPCKVYYKDVAMITMPERKIRCTKLEILE